MYRLACALWGVGLCGQDQAELTCLWSKTAVQGSCVKLARRRCKGQGLDPAIRRAVTCACALGCRAPEDASEAAVRLMEDCLMVQAADRPTAKQVIERLQGMAR